MQIYRELEALPELNKPSATTIGVFDGVHLGHQAIIAKTVEMAASINGVSVVITFDRHPLAIVHPEATPPTLTAADLKADYIEQLGVDILVMIPFTREIADIQPESFVDRILVDKLHTEYLIIGEDFSFGKDRKGTIEFLRSYGAPKGINVEVMPHLKKNGVVISSTEIRSRMTDGDIEGVRELVGRYPQFRGVIVHGLGRGGTLIGIPTANIELRHDELLPESGVYAGRACIDNVCWPCVIDIGMSPTFGDVATVEVQVHIIGYKKDLYGENIDVELIKRLRGEQKFSSVDSLKAQIMEDIDRAKDVIANVIKSSQINGS